jgi:hypothetical protein
MRRKDRAKKINTGENNAKNHLYPIIIIFLA